MPTGARRRARECALQILFGLDVQGLAPERPESFVDLGLRAYWNLLAEEVEPEAREFCDQLVRGTAARLAEIDALVQKVSRNWRLERMARVDRNILRLATYELLHVAEVPTRVVINEAIEVAKRFGASESGAFVNGLLDRIAQEVRRT